MGGALGTAAGKVGNFLGNIISSPVKSFFGKTCEDKCGDWDGVCYIENGCVASLIRLLKACGLAFITALFLYVVLSKTGLLKCVVKKSCKLSWKACRGCFHGLGAACAFLWNKLRNTKRVYRGRRAEAELTGISWSDTDWSGSTSFGSSRKRGRSPVRMRERRKDRVRQPTGPPSKLHVEPHHHSAKRSRTETDEHSPHHHRTTGTARHDHGRVHRARQH